ncbi:jg6252 [Pararge aegeria aegeria]|uniref:Jg6252 protein n=1 Tax=Pararge aegeria aegeria TaxID=348720 RepID=A0A8S4SK17_9NEOP|nr:jg6252 [Pararge aegeria aegeria]
MLNGTFRYCSHIRCINPVVAITGNGLVEAASALAYLRNYCKDKGSCCKDIAQTHGKRVEPWPKCDLPPPAWRHECPYEPQPPNYDPYRIKVPDVVCPPLPPSKAKWTAVLWTSQTGNQGNPPQQQGYGPYPNYGQQNPPGTEEQVEEEPPSAGFFGFLKGLFRGKAKPKEDGEVSMETTNDDREQAFMTSAIKFDSTIKPLLDLFQSSPVIHPDYWKETKKLPAGPNDMQDPLPRLGYHGKNKFKYAFHEPWKPLDRLTLLSQAEKEEFEGQKEDGQTEVLETEKC